MYVCGANCYSILALSWLSKAIKTLTTTESTTVWALTSHRCLTLNVSSPNLSVAGDCHVWLCICKVITGKGTIISGGNHKMDLATYQSVRCLCHHLSMFLSYLKKNFLKRSFPYLRVNGDIYTIQFMMDNKGPWSIK